MFRIDMRHSLARSRRLRDGLDTAPRCAQSDKLEMRVVSRVLLTTSETCAAVRQRASFSRASADTVMNSVTNYSSAGLARPATLITIQFLTEHDRRNH
jgi:hypothetical protein